MIRFTASDLDGRPIYYASVHDDYDLRRYHERLERTARNLGCLIREIPELGSTSEGPFHPGFKITRDASGMITEIRRPLEAIV